MIRVMTEKGLSGNASLVSASVTRPDSDAVWANSWSVVKKQIIQKIRVHIHA